MIEEVYGCEPLGSSDNPSPIGGLVLVQHSKDDMDIGVGITLNREGLEQYLRDHPRPSDLGSPGNPDNGLSFYVRLQRPQVNRLVRLLRKARDNAFGRDE